MTSKYPDIAMVVPRATADGVHSFIIDAEAVAMDRSTGEIRPFQVLSTRKRKDASVDNITVQVCVFAFDLLYLNGEPLLREQFARRRELLYKTFTPIPKELEVRAGTPWTASPIACLHGRPLPHPLVCSCERRVRRGWNRRVARPVHQGQLRGTDGQDSGPGRNVRAVEAVAQLAQGQEGLFAGHDRLV
jgi:hypothetical protein